MYVHRKRKKIFFNNSISKKEGESMLDGLNKLSKDQKGMVAVGSGVVVLLFSLGIIPGLPTLLMLSGIALIVLGLYILQVHTKLLALINKK